MKQVQKAYNACKKRMPNRPPDKIDFGLGWRAALEWVLSKYSIDKGEAEKKFPHIKKELQ